MDTGKFLRAKVFRTFIIICSEIERNGDGYEHWRPYWIKVAPSSRGKKKKVGKTIGLIVIPTILYID